MRNRNLSLRNAALLLAALFCTGLLGGCRVSPQATGDSSEIVTGALPGEDVPTLEIWMLTEASGPGRSIRNLGAQQSDFRIEIEYAHTETDKGRINHAQTDEKIRLLNVRLLAGAGPDIIVLDGCPIARIAATNVLADVADIAREAGVYENLVQSLMVDGQLPYIPYRAKATLLAGDPALLAQIENFAALAEKTAAGPVTLPQINTSTAFPIDPLLRNVPPLPEEERAWVSFNDYISIVDFAGVLYGPWLVKDNQVNLDLLAECYIAIGQLVSAMDISSTLSPGESRTILSCLSTSFPDFLYYYFGESAINQYLGYSLLAAGMDMPCESLAITARASEGDFEVWPLPTGKGAVWQPYALMGVNIQAKNPELARRFLEIMLNDEQQTVLYESYLPVTESAVRLVTEEIYPQALQRAYPGFEAVYGEGSGSIQWMLAEGFPYDLDGLMRRFDTAYITDSVVYDTFFTYAMGYAEGHRSLEDALAATEEALALYFAEMAR